MNFQTNKVFFTTMECKSHYHIGPEKLVVISHLIQGNLFRSVDNKTVLKKKGNLVMAIF